MRLNVSVKIKIVVYIYIINVLHLHVLWRVVVREARVFLPARAVDLAFPLRALIQIKPALPLPRASPLRPRIRVGHLLAAVRLLPRFKVKVHVVEVDVEVRFITLLLPALVAAVRSPRFSRLARDHAEVQVVQVPRTVPLLPVDVLQNLINLVGLLLHFHSLHFNLFGQLVILGFLARFRLEGEFLISLEKRVLALIARLQPFRVAFV